MYDKTVKDITLILKEGFSKIKLYPKLKAIQTHVTRRFIYLYYKVYIPTLTNILWASIQNIIKEKLDFAIIQK